MRHSTTGWAALCALAVAALAAGCASGGGRSASSRPAALPATTAPTSLPPVTTTVAATTTTVQPPRPAATSSPTTAAAAAQLAGCPVPPHPPLPVTPPWHPSTLVPDAALPAVTAPVKWNSDLAPIAGTGMWIWQWSATDHGDAAQVVAQAVAAHLHQLWIRVGDSMNGFYGQQELAQLVPAAHAAGLAVIAWGFPYLYDPARDAGWTGKILSWRSSHGDTVDGYSADIEEATEGVDLTATRAAVYLELVRRAAGSRLIVATVYAPTDANWNGVYPYHAMAPYVDAFAPMIYWECTDPGADAAADVARMAPLRPVHIIGQAFDMADVGGRAVAPSGAEITEFLGAGRRAGAIGASLWVWQHATQPEWAAVRAFAWSPSGRA